MLIVISSMASTNALKIQKQKHERKKKQKMKYSSI